jgi:hypothetical protein
LVSGIADELCESARCDNWTDKSKQCGKEAKFWEPRDAKTDSE